MRLTVLGAGTLLPDDRHRSPSHWLEDGELRLLLDCGSGSLHSMGRFRLFWKGLTHIAITHFHTDHVGDLPAILFALRHGVRPPREEPLVLLGPRGLEEHLDLLARAYGPYIREPGFPIEVHELGHGARWTDPAGRFTLATQATPHTGNSLALRVETERGAVGYTGDTGPTPELGTFFAGVETLISECSLADPAESEVHMSPARVAALAVSARPGLLIATHLYPPLRPHQLPDLMRAAGWDGPFVVARDGTTVEIARGAARLVD